AAARGAARCLSGVPPAGARRDRPRGTAWMNDIGPLVAFAAGLFSFLSPCVLPLVPSYLGFLTGMTLEEMSDRRHWAFWHALVFVLGFSLVFIAMGAGATALGATLRYHK